MAKARDFIIFSTADWDAPYWTNKQHTAQYLARHGCRVLYIESIGLRTPNLGSSRDLSRLLRRLIRGFRGVRKVSEGIWVLSPLVLPFKHHVPVVRSMNQGVLRFLLSRFIRSNAFMHPVLWTYHPFMLDAVTGLSAGPIVYHCVDDLSTVPGIHSKSVADEEHRLLAAAKIVFTTSLALRDKCSALHHSVHYFPNVVDVDHFGKALQNGQLPSDLAAIPEPRIGYIGALSDYKVDFRLLEELSAQRPDWQFVLIGEEREGQANPVLDQLRRRPNVHLLGHRPYETLPDYLRGINVALLPTLLNDYTHSMFPMKYFEYLAAGIPMVSTPLSFTQYHQAGLETARDAAGFEQAVQRQLGRGKFSVQESIGFVGDNTWTARLQKMLAMVEDSA